MRAISNEMFRLALFVAGCWLVRYLPPLVGGSITAQVSSLITAAICNELFLRFIFLTHLKLRPRASYDAALFLVLALYLIFFTRILFGTAPPFSSPTSHQSAAVHPLAGMALHSGLYLMAARIVYTGLVVTRFWTAHPRLFGFAAAYCVKRAMPSEKGQPAYRWWDDTGEMAGTFFQNNGSAVSRIVSPFLMTGRHTLHNALAAAFYAGIAHQALLASFLKRGSVEEKDNKAISRYFLALGNTLLEYCLIEAQMAKGRHRAERAIFRMEDMPAISAELNAFCAYSYLSSWADVMARKNMTGFPRDAGAFLVNSKLSASASLSLMENRYKKGNSHGNKNIWMGRAAGRLAQISGFDGPEGNVEEFLGLNGFFLGEMAMLAVSAEAGKTNMRTMFMNHEAAFLASALLMKPGPEQAGLFLKMAEEWDSAAILPEDILWLAAWLLKIEEQNAVGYEEEPYLARRRAKTLLWERRAVCAAMMNVCSIGFVPGHIRWNEDIC